MTPGCGVGSVNQGPGELLSFSQPPPEIKDQQSHKHHRIGLHRDPPFLVLEYLGDLIQFAESKGAFSVFAAGRKPLVFGPPHQYLSKKGTEGGVLLQAFYFQ